MRPAPRADVESRGAPPDHISLFFYGTLRTGECGHGLVAPFLESVQPARIPGRLRWLPGGYPALRIPAEAVLAEGTADVVADAAAARAMGRPEVVTGPGDWTWVEGEIAVLRDPARALPRLDRYEEFEPGGHSLYQRVLACVETPFGPKAAWLYVKQDLPE